MSLAAAAVAPTKCCAAAADLAAWPPGQQVVRSHMDAPTLRLTAEGKSALERYIRQITDFDAVVSVLWATSASAMRLTENGEEEFENIGPHWGVGFTARGRFPPSEIVEIDGIPFVFGQGPTSQRLNGATLHFLDGRFVVAESAI